MVADGLYYVPAETNNNTYLTPLSPAATIFWKISSQRSGTGSRKVWNSPELKRRQRMYRAEKRRLDILKEYALVVDE